MEVVFEVTRRGTNCGRPEPGAVLFLFHLSGGTCFLRIGSSHCSDSSFRLPSPKNNCRVLVMWQVVTTTFLGSTCAPAKRLGMVESASLPSRSGFVYFSSSIFGSLSGWRTCLEEGRDCISGLDSLVSAFFVGGVGVMGSFVYIWTARRSLASLFLHICAHLRTSAHISRLRQRFFGILEISRSELESATAAHHDESSVSWCTLM